MALCDHCRSKGLNVCELALRQRKGSDEMVAGLLNLKAPQKVAVVYGPIIGVAAAILECTVFVAPPPPGRLPKPDQS